MTELRTQRLVLRAARSDERAALFRIYANARAMRYWDTHPHQTEADTAEMHAHLSQPGERRYFAWDHGGEIVGAGGIHSGTELGFILHPDHWGRGLAREACEALIAHIWASTDLPCITAEADPRNLASVGLLTRLGFQVTGYAERTLYLYEEWCNSVDLTLSRPGTCGPT